MCLDSPVRHYVMGRISRLKWPCKQLQSHCTPNSRFEFSMYGVIGLLFLYTQTRRSLFRAEFA